MSAPRHRLALLAWAAAVVASTLVHDPVVLTAALLLALLVSGTGRLALAGRAVRAVAAILLLISAGYVGMSMFSGTLDTGVLMRFNLRVLLIAVLTAWMLREVRLVLALSGWPAAQRWLLIVQAQITLFRRLAQDYRLARRSRSTVAPTLRQRYLGVSSLTLAALDKAVHNAETVTQALRARGALDE
ncbi:MAG: hypothetical protein JJT93_01130 [Gammaproteobacteria bacterium]|nr:hypothetical protein [Gammaproteobacteria bacterium]